MMADVGNRARLAEIAGTAPVPADLEPEEFERVEFARVSFSMYMALVAEAIPRRLGRDATSVALALDKRVARKVLNTYRVTWLRLSQLTGVDGPPGLNCRSDRLELARSAGPGPRRAGATVSWGRWLPDRIAEVDDLRRTAALLALHEGKVVWGWRRVRILEDELENLERIAKETALQLRRRSDAK